MITLKNAGLPYGYAAYKGMRLKMKG